MEKIDQLESAVLKMANYIALSEARDSVAKGYPVTGDSFTRLVETISKDILGDLVP